MIKEKELRECRDTYRYSDGQAVTLESLQNAIIDKANQYQLPLNFQRDQIKGGNIISPVVEDCIVFYHPAHQKDYFRFAIKITRQGTMAFVHTYDFGESKNIKKLNTRSAAASVFKQGITKGQAGGSFAGSIAGLHTMVSAVGALKSLGGSKAKQEEENNYYAALMGVFEEVIH